MAVCHNMAVPRSADVVVLEYAINDGSANSISGDFKKWVACRVHGRGKRVCDGMEGAWGGM